MDHDIVRLIDRPELKDAAAKWFSEKWGISQKAYLDSMDACIKAGSAVPQWYVVMENERIIAGMGVIENDFHDRRDLAPNICAVYTEKDKRGCGIAGRLLDFVCNDMKARGIDTLYLVTEHTSFYERFGWKFICMVNDENNGCKTRMYMHKA